MARITKAHIDRYTLLSTQVAPLLDELNELKKLLRSKGPGLYGGTNTAVIVDTHETQTLDQKIVKTLLTPGQIVEATRTGSRTTIKVIDVVEIKLVKEVA